jgi:hypothetical protein
MPSVKKTKKCLKLEKLKREERLYLNSFTHKLNKCTGHNTKRNEINV